MKFLPAIFLAFIATAHATPIKIKDTKGREISVTITAYSKSTVSFEKGGKKFTVPWATFDAASIKLIKSTPLPEAANKRTERSETITLEDGSKKEMTVPAGDILSADGILDLYPGDTIHLEFSKSGETLVKPKVVASVTKPEQTITFHFAVSGGGITLKRTTKIQKTVALDCFEKAVDSEKHTLSQSFFPTEKGQTEEQTWPNKIWHLQMKNIEVTDKTAEQVFNERSRR
jgi:hypothetical protein